MRTAESDKIFTLEEYIQYELASERRHEFINGQLFEMPGEKDINNEIAFMISVLLSSFLKEKGYVVYNHDVKLAIPNENKYYYPDVFLTKEERNESNRYIKYQPEIIVEVVSETTQVPGLKHNRVDTGFDWYKFGELVKSHYDG